MIPVFILLFLILCGVPIGVALGTTSIALFITGNLPLTIVPIMMVDGLAHFVFLAMPLFILAGELMNRSGIGEDLVELAASLVGAVRGGLAMVNIGASMAFAEISGSSVADVACLGPILIPQMVKRGYPKAFAAALTSTSATMAGLIPPSIPLIIYGALANESIIKLFIAGIIPGIIMGLTLALFAYGFALFYGWPAESKFQFRRAFHAFRRAMWSLTIPIIILGGILGGIFTATEAAAAAAGAALFIGLFVARRRLKLSDLPGIILISSKRTSVVLLMMATSALFGWYISNEGITDAIVEMVMAISDNRHVVMFWFNILLIMAGMVLHGNALLVLIVPLTLPLMAALGYDPVHFGIILAVNLGIGAQTPPVASVLAAAVAVTGLSMGQIMRYNIWFILALFIVLQFITYIPELSLWLPSVVLR